MLLLLLFGSTALCSLDAIFAYSFALFGGGHRRFDDVIGSDSNRRFDVVVHVTTWRRFEVTGNLGRGNNLDRRNSFKIFFNGFALRVIDGGGD